MSHFADGNRRRILAGSSQLALAALFLTNPMTELLVRSRVATGTAIALTGFTVVLMMPLLVASVYGLTHLMRERAYRTALAGAAITILGWAAGVRIIALGQFESLLESSGSGGGEELVALVMKSPGIFASIVPIGILFAVGLIVLGIAMLIARPLGPVPGVLLVAGGVLFPVGRAIGNVPAYHATDVLLGIALAWIGWQTLARPALWGGVAEAPRVTSDVRLVAGGCAVAVAAAFFSNPFTNLLTPGGDRVAVNMAAVGFLSVLLLGLMVGALLGVTGLLRSSADRTGLTGAAMAIIGWTASARIMILAQLEVVVRNDTDGALTARLGQTLSDNPVVFVSLVPVGLFFPIGMIVLGVALLRAPHVGRWMGALVLAGGLLFPIGRAMRIQPAVVATDVVLTVAFALIGRELLRGRREVPVAVAVAA